MRVVFRAPELLSQILRNSYRLEHVVVNLETVITEADQLIIKCGPNLKCKPAIASGLKSLNIMNCFANNHIMDQQRLPGRYYGIRR